MGTMASQRWTEADIVDQTGRTFVVTGANSGLGLQSTKALTAAGARVIMACRNTEKAEAAREELPADSRALAEVHELDLGDLRSVDSFVSTIEDRGVDVLINNAGVMDVPLGRTEQGFEQQFGVNVLGHFALTAELEHKITDRVVWLGSLMHQLGWITLDDLNYERRSYNSWLAYGQSKLACVMLAYEQQRRFVRAGSSLRAVVAHPGYSATNLQSHSGNAVVRQIMKLGNSLPLLAQPADRGALPELYAATVPDLPGGWYIGPDGPGEVQGFPRPVASNKRSYDVGVAERLWDACAELVERR